MDAIDMKLLSALQEDGSLTNAELADRVGLSASQCSRRRAALEKAGIIQGVRVLLSPEGLGLEVTVLVQVRLATHSAHNARRFEELVGDIDEVQECYLVTGDYDYSLKMVLKDLKTLATILNKVFLAHDSVSQVHSTIVLERTKETSKLPINSRLPLM
ncbi:Lrp/AsnC family transcriptional regulator [Cucumibacter marinus]|uniref:Lrp/AsnC family transcriptional regulator n=1 Tax=Cucumibacter marinus TaxID=1121252 RepID=UPI0003FFB89E|nr:Lrp/AsnC family transcriptional regulator [Cucumibacter marinus]